MTSQTAVRLRPLDDEVTVENDDGYVINGRRADDYRCRQRRLPDHYGAHHRQVGRDIGATMFMADMDIEAAKSFVSSTPWTAILRAAIRSSTTMTSACRRIDLGEAGKVSATQVLGAAHSRTACAGRRRAALSRYRRRLRPQPPCLRQAALRARRRQLPTCRQFTGPAPEPPQHLHTAWVLDQGERGGNESSMAKVFCSEAVGRVVDRSVQILGGMGITNETVVMRTYKDIRAFRIYDGPSEVHRWAIARHIMRANK